MKYILIREDGQYVAPPGRLHSYTNKLQHAKVYHSLGEAQQDKCGNETIVSLEEAFGRA